MLKNFFIISDLSKEQLLKIIDLDSKEKILIDKNIGMIFEKYSTRTRLSFAVAISKLGGERIDIKFQDLNISREESFEDTFKAMNCYLDGLIYRTSDHNNLINASKFFLKPIVNALSDKSHPCQIISDLFTIKENFGSLKINILWMGDMNNVCFSLVEAANLLSEINLTICCPAGISNLVSWEMKPNIKVLNDIDQIDLSSINCVMTDVFISMNDRNNKEKIELLKSFRVTKNLISQTSKDSIFMHCLPANVGLEVTKDVFHSKKSIVWKQAYNRLPAQKKLLQVLKWN